MRTTQETHVLRRGTGGAQTPSPSRDRAEKLFRRPPQDPEAGPSIIERATGVPAQRGVKSQPGPGAIQRRKDFIRLINKRVPMAIDAISSIANLANPKNYKSNTSDWNQVLDALRKAVDNLEARVRSPEEAAPVFELREEEE
jgi:hypothetical protein